MRPPRTANALIGNYPEVKDKPTWQRHLYARLAERAGEEGKLSYGDRDASAKNPTRHQIQVWYEQIYSELAQAYADLEEERDRLKTANADLRQAVTNMEQSLRDTHENLTEMAAHRAALMDVITRAHMAEGRVEDYVKLYGPS